ncbi:outer membrane insertion signal domain protein [Ancylostoma caninum]|uniref:Outer membrane insertion signal domain protein n=1 Tax=Ancylostoma caninum TaxID=29170 RepID=A0A368FYX8_ANCCA|nr:outer membrane insertion signal domain protein [Ancylostoma caninum]
MIIKCNCSDTLDALYHEVLERSSKSNVDSRLALAKAQAEIMGDLFLNVAVLQSVISLLESGVKSLFFYDFDYFNPDSWGPSLKLHFKEATHSTDVAYVFGLGINYDFTFTADDIKMLNQTTTLWTNFVKYG